MKRLIILFLACYSLNAYAQQKDIFKNKPWEDAKKKLLSNPLQKLKPDMSNFSFDTNKENRMPVLKTPLERRYAGNNGKGSDIYVMEPYNMPCLVPDKTFTSKMPVAGLVQRADNNLLFSKPVIIEDNGKNLAPQD